jgi:site-specific recombinase XerD
VFIVGRKLPKVTASAAKLLKVANRRAPTGLRNYCMMLLMYRGGMRVSEVTAVQPSWINWKDGQIRVMGKGNKDRIIPLETWVIDALAEWKMIRPTSKFFFCTLAGGVVSRQYINMMLERYSKRAEIPKVNPHMLRHTYATELMNEGYNIREVQQVLGHSSITTTQIYTHVNPVELRGKIQARRIPG